MKTPTENIIATLTGKRVLFLENDNTLDNGVDEFERILTAAGIEHTVLFDLSEKPKTEIISAINSHDAIVFMTRWLYDISHELYSFIKSLQDKKIIVEAYIAEPTWYYASQHGSHHDVYIYSCQVNWGEADKESETFYKLTDTAYWDYKNEFDA